MTDIKTQLLYAFAYTGGKGTTITFDGKPLTLEGNVVMCKGKPLLTLDDRCTLSSDSRNFTVRLSDKDVLIEGIINVAMAGTRFPLKVVRNPVAANSVVVNTTRHFILTGKQKPTGNSHWRFGLNGVPLWVSETAMAYGAAKKQAQAWAAQRGLQVLDILSMI